MYKKLSETEDAKTKKTQVHLIKKVLSNQMLSRLPISLAQLKGGSNSEKLKNEIKQRLYSSYR